MPVRRSFNVGFGYQLDVGFLILSFVSDVHLFLDEDMNGFTSVTHVWCSLFCVLYLFVCMNHINIPVQHMQAI